jgi:putative heme iron utilization protein
VRGGTTRVSAVSSTTPPTDHEVPAGASRRLPPVVLGRESTDAERARTLAATMSTGILSTIARDEAGTPFGSLAPFGLDGEARPVLCISELAEHTRNLRTDTRCSLLVAQFPGPGGDPLAAPRLTLVGRAGLVPDAEVGEARAAHLAGNPHAAGYIDYGDFSLWRLEVQSVRYVGGYGRMSWVDLAAWRDAEPDPVEPFAAGAIEHLNADHADACLLMVQRLGSRPDAETAVVTRVDRYGMDLEAAGPDGAGFVRLPFDAPVSTPPEIRAATVALARQARQAREPTA